MKVVIIGAGLGGLLSGAKLSKAGYAVEIFERLPFIGGRFANLNYKGFKLSTGALHMIPHGTRGPLSQIFREVGAEVSIKPSKPVGLIRLEDNSHIGFNEFHKFLSLPESVKLITLLISSRMFRPKNIISYKDWILKYFDNEFLLKRADSICGWSLSMQAKDVPAQEMLDIIFNIIRYGGPGIPIGGCGAVIESLASVIKSNGGNIHVQSSVEKIITDKDSAKGIIVNRKTIEADFFISDIGHLQTSGLFECTDMGYLKKINKIKPSKGIKICISSDEPLIGHSGVIFTLFTQRINGIIEVTNADPALAPPGKHLVMSHQVIQSTDLNQEIALGLEDLKRLFPGKKYEVLLIQSYSDAWPVNREASGGDFGNTTPIRNLYIVGDGAKGKGGIEVEGVALGVKNVMREMEIE